MKTIISFASLLLLSISNLNFEGVSTEADPQELIGMWKLDMTPHIPDDNQFAIMEIGKINDNTFKGIFYREGVKIQNGQLNSSTGRIYGALVSGDNSGSYNTSFYLEDGKLYGSTHAIERNFLSVWVATKEE
ncbi:hypothetical protein O3Q51_17130 [Cryomorphaceae bacterium 1068]|nr:hypothetical protein [Cryomorphaceae bacterium 1068]